MKLFNLNEYNILTNDRTNLGAAIIAGTITIIASPTHGTVGFNAAGAVTYTPTNPALVGVDTFTYRVTPTTPLGSASNVATVTITTTAPVGGPAPIAVNDGPFNVQQSTALDITAATLIANDSANGGSAIAPATIQIVPGSVTGGTAVVAPATGNVTYTAGAVAGAFGFSYTVANATGQRSAPASVAMNVVAAADVLRITRAQFRTGTSRWDLAGTSTGTAPVTVTLVRTGQVIAANIPVAGGAWTINVIPSTVVPGIGDTVRATTTAGGNATLNDTRHTRRGDLGGIRPASVRTSHVGSVLSEV